MQNDYDEFDKDGLATNKARANHSKQILETFFDMELCRVLPFKSSVYVFYPLLVNDSVRLLLCFVQADKGF